MLDRSSQVGMSDLQSHLDTIVQRVKKGEEITVTQRGKPVMRLVKAPKEFDVSKRTAAIERMIKRSKGLSLGRLRVRDLIQEGRR